MGARTLLALPDKAFEDIGFLLEHIDQATQVGEAMQLIGFDQDLGSLATKIAFKLGQPRDVVLNLIQSLLNLFSLRDRLCVDTSGLLDAIGLSIEADAQPTWREKYQAIWSSDETSRSLGNLLQPDGSIDIFQKSIDLLYSHQNVLHDVRIITDIRPVFNSDGTGIISSIVTHSLVLEYSDSGKLRKLQLAMDSNDISQLKECCDRAVRKVVSIKDAFANLPWRINIPGEDKNDP